MILVTRIMHTTLLYLSYTPLFIYRFTSYSQTVPFHSLSPKHLSSALDRVDDCDLRPSFSTAVEPLYIDPALCLAFEVIGGNSFSWTLDPYGPLGAGPPDFDVLLINTPLPPPSTPTIAPLPPRIACATRLVNGSGTRASKRVSTHLLRRRFAIAGLRASGLKRSPGMLSVEEERERFRSWECERVRRGGGAEVWWMLA